MKASEISRVVHLCLPKIQTSNTTTISLHDASDLQVQTMCSLWSGMGHIYKVTLPTTSSNDKRTASGTAVVQLVVKHVAPPRSLQQSKGDRRKADSYQIEANFYEKLAPLLIRDHGLRLPEPFLVERDSGKAKNEIVIVMSHIEQSKSADLLNEVFVKAVLEWLATLHASYWGAERVDAIVDRVGLQNIGSYWHLDTRPEEHESMPNKGWEGRLKRAARAIDERLKRDTLQCLIHGDTKDANMLFSENNIGEPIATLCDFQYCGKGPPTKDLAYFFCSSASLDDEEAALEFYLEQLIKRLPADAMPPTMEELKDSLELAYCDFYRFMSGWGYWGSGGEDRVKAVLNRLDGGKDLGSEEAYDESVRREYG
jgi:Phosphotransferase enzyme family